MFPTFHGASAAAAIAVVSVLQVSRSLEEPTPDRIEEVLAQSADP